MKEILFRHLLFEKSLSEFGLRKDLQVRDVVFVAESVHVRVENLSESRSQYCLLQSGESSSWHLGNPERKKDATHLAYQLFAYFPIHFIDRRSVSRAVEEFNKLLDDFRIVFGKVDDSRFCLLSE